MGVASHHMSIHGIGQFGKSSQTSASIVGASIITHSILIPFS